VRRHSIICDASQLDQNDHVAWCGDGRETLDRVAVSAFSYAAKRGEQLLFVSERPDPERLAALDDVKGLLHRGALQLTTVEATYSNMFDAVAQRAAYEQLLNRALAEGYTGMCVVVDSSHLLGHSDEEFAAWLALEAAADRLEANRPVTGVCYFDRQAVPSHRLADLAAIHPVLSSGFGKPTFQVFFDGDVMRVVGEVDALCADQLRRILASSPAGPMPVLDLSGVEFMDHRALLTLNEVARERHGLCVRGAKPFVREVWRLLDLARPELEFC
jgi:anti-anti-sigma regulatory factor